MRLSYIKLAGFKSFVEPTKVVLPGQMTCIVGPNGCGKSNVIDAVRWVLGESSAKNLRGGSMTDVIFNGSSTRKPISQASVELVFEQTGQRLLGEFADYQEISVKRIVNRDGLSSYYLNNTKCRRRDITDLFMGTGLGPRSYAIIEQGTISRLIESKPQELRVFIEEAAGISKYKERRRETQSRMERTQDNLARLLDVREEQTKQYEKLKRQAKTAQKYQEYREQERFLKAELHALHWLNYHTKTQELSQDIERLLTEQEQLSSQKTRLELQQMQGQQAVYDYQDSVEQTQSQYYEAVHQVKHIEQQVRFEQQNQHRLTQERNKYSEQLQQAKHELQQEQERTVQLQEEMQQAKEELEIATLYQEDCQRQLDGHRAQLEAYQQESKAVNQKVQEYQAIQSKRSSRLSHVEDMQQFIQEQNEAVEQQIEAIKKQLHAYEQNSDTAQLEQWQAREQEELSHIQLLDSQIERLQQQKRVQEQQAQRYHIQVSKLTTEQDTLQQMLQEQEVSLSDAEQSWLSASGAQGVLADYIQAPEQWQQAISLAVQPWLHAYVVKRIPEKRPEGLQANLVCSPIDMNKEQARKQSLSHYFTIMVPSLFHRFALVEQQSEALELLQDDFWLACFTADGLCIGQGWELVIPETEAQVLTWRARLSVIEQELVQLIEIEQECHARLAQLQEQIDTRVPELEQWQSSIRHSQTEQVRLQSAIHSAKRHEHDLQQQQLEKQEALRIGVLKGQELVQEAKELHAQLKSVTDQLAVVLPEHEKRQEKTTALAEGVNLLQKDMQVSMQNVYDKQLRVQQARIDGEQSRQLQERLSQQLHQYKQELEVLSAQDTANDEVYLLQEQLQESVLQMELQEQELQQKKELLETKRQEQTLQEQCVAEIQQQISSVREQIETKRLKQATFKERAQTQQEALQELEQSLQCVLDKLNEERELSVVEEELKDVQYRIGNLGAINLAALQEVEVQAEKVEHLDKQYQDLQASLELLEAAIRKIDRETRSRFKETFERINTSLQALFPKVFSGGAAYLELTDDDLLETGVTIMARPPGKRNASIQLLSGGEKALTALALVFSIFQLNPAPFCLLDEVDAPLDDANVGRFCRLVEEMSDSVQFMYISHNKIAMEMASHLMGVTMQEPGVSRLVSVDVQEAMTMND